jgi:sugar diacid utilization regulator
MASINTSRRIADCTIDQTTRARTEYLLISEIFQTLTQAAPIHSTLETITGAVCSRLGISSCAILLEHSGDDLLVIEGAAGLSASYVEAVNRNFPVHIEELGLSESPSSLAFRTGRVVIIEDTDTDPDFLRWRRLARQQGYRSLVSVPLRWQEHVIGTMCCYQHEPRRFHEDELETLATVATQVAIAVQVARLVDTQQQTIGRLEELTRELNAQRRLLERSAEVHSQLTRLVLNNQGIPAIASTLARVVGCPVLVQDQFYQVLAGATPRGDSLAEVGPLTREVLARHVPRGREVDSHAPFEITATPKHGLKLPRVAAPIIAGTHLLGYVSLELPDLPPPELHVRALGQAATVLALEMVKDRLAHEVEQRVRRGFADDLIAGRYDDAEQMRDRARYLGYDLTGPFQVLVFDIDQFGRYVAEQRLSEADIDALRRRFADALLGVARHHAPRATVAGRHDRLSLIFSRVDTASSKLVDSVIAAVRSRAEQTLPGLTVSVGVGRVYADPDQVRTSYQEASQAILVLRRLGGVGKTVAYSDMGITRLLLHVENPAELIEFARKRLQPVLAYDEHHNGILIAALEGFLGANQSISQAAEQLDLHPNTLRYRLRKVEELLHCALSDLAQLLDLQLACIILRLAATA